MSLTTASPIELATPSLAGLFPLALTPMESFMVLDAREDYPMICDLELHFQGYIDREAFDAALALAMARNPLFGCLIGRDSKGAWVWNPTDRLPHVDWAPLGTPIAGNYGKLIDLASDIGLRIWVRQGADRSTVLLHFHHACADGMGCYGFIEDLMAAYSANIPGAVAVAPRPLNPEFLKQRGVFGIPKRSPWQQVGDVLIGMVESLRFLLGAPLALRRCREQSTAGVPMTFRSHVFSAETVAALRRQAGQAGATLNDLLIRDLLIALRHWQGAGGSEPGRRRLRILMPQNLREPKHSAMPAAIAMSFAFVSRRAKCCADPDRLLRSIHNETEAIRRNKLSLYFLGGMAAAQAVGLLGWLLRQRLCFATAVLTNLSDPTRRFVARFPRSPEGLVVGNLFFQGITGGPPLRPRTRSAWSIVQSANSLTISLKCDPRSYGPADVEGLLDEYAQQLLATAKNVPPAKPAAV